MFIRDFGIYFVISSLSLFCALGKIDYYKEKYRIPPERILTFLTDLKPPFNFLYIYFYQLHHYESMQDKLARLDQGTLLGGILKIGLSGSFALVLIYGLIMDLLLRSKTLIDVLNHSFWMTVSLITLWYGFRFGKKLLTNLHP
jgi:hypothetical protein